MALEHLLRPSDEHARQQIDRNHSRCRDIREAARSSVNTLVEKKVSRTAAQELDARLRMLGSVSSAHPPPPSRRTTIALDLGASSFRGLFLVSALSGVVGFSRVFRRIREASSLVPPAPLLPTAEAARPTCDARAVAGSIAG